MAANPLTEIANFGQSVWYDNISRSLVRDGELQRLINEDGVVGQTSNPNFFKEAIVGKTDYDEQMRDLARQGKNGDEIYEVLTTTDVRGACDLFAPVYQRTNGHDGYVSIEVSPTLAHDTKHTVEEARRLWKVVDRPNVMIKIPAAPEGIPAIKQALSEGINVNVTLVFSIASYRDVMNAYIEALEARVQRGEPVDRLASVGSFFVSRVDVAVDKMLDEKIKNASGAEKEKLQSLLGKAAIANAKEAYHVFRETFSGPRWEALAAKGAKVQRPLWASTGAKNPAYRDILYAEELIGPDTVDTMGPPTIEAFRDHGRVRNSVEEDYPGAQRVLKELADAGINMAKVTQDLQDAGIKQFSDSFEAIMKDVRAKSEEFAAAGAHAAD
jgi:transaldolase